LTLETPSDVVSIIIIYCVRTQHNTQYQGTYMVTNTCYFAETDHRIPWSRNRPNVATIKNQVVNSSPPPPPPRTKTSTGVACSSLKYKASDHIKELAKHRPKPKVVDEKNCFSVKPLSLVYKPSLRILELSKPRIHEKTT